MKYLLFLSFLAYSFVGVAQVKTIFVDYKGKKVTESNADYKRKIEKVGKHFKVTELYLNDSIHMTGTFTNKALTKKEGEFRDYYLNGQCKTIVQYKDNKKEGVESSFQINGKPFEERNYSEGELAGMFKRFDEFGNLERETDARKIEMYYSEVEYAKGMTALQEELGKITYPKLDVNKGNNAYTFTSFIVDTLGQIRNIDFIVSGTDAMSKELVRTISKLSDWKVARKNGKKIESTLFLPLRFYLSSSTVKKEPSKKVVAKAIYNSAWRDLKKKEFRSAISKLETAIERDNMEAKNYLLMGLCYLNLKNESIAIENFKIAQSLDSEILPAEIKEALAKQNSL